MNRSVDHLGLVESKRACDLERDHRYHRSSVGIRRPQDRLCACLCVRHDRHVTQDQRSTSRDLRNLPRALSGEGRVTGSRAWRLVVVPLALVVMGGASVVAVYWFLAAIFVGLPQAIVNATWNGPCVAGAGIDCTRAIADARQSVLFAAGGIIAIIGLYYTYRRWKLEYQNTEVAVAEGRVIEERHVREGEQLDLTRIMEATTLLRGDDNEMRVVALSLLSDYITRVSHVRHARLILDVVAEYIRDHCKRNEALLESGTDWFSIPRNDNIDLAVRTLLNGSITAKISVDLSHLVFVGVNGSGTNWTYAHLEGARFIGCRLSGAQFAPRDRPLESVRFQGCALDKANFRGCRLEKVSFDGWRFKFTAGRSLESSDFASAELWDVTFAGMILADSIFARASLHNVAFAHSHLSRVDFSRAFLSNVDFSLIFASRGNIDLRHVAHQNNIKDPEGKVKYPGDNKFNAPQAGGVRQERTAGEPSHVPIQDSHSSAPGSWNSYPGEIETPGLVVPEFRLEPVDHDTDMSGNANVAIQNQDTPPVGAWESYPSGVSAGP